MGCNSSSNLPADAKKTLFDQTGETLKLNDYVKKLASTSTSLDDVKAAIAGLDDATRSRLVALLEAFNPRALTEYAASIEATNLDDSATTRASCSDENKKRTQATWRKITHKLGALSASAEPMQGTKNELVDQTVELKAMDISCNGSKDENKEEVENKVDFEETSSSQSVLSALDEPKQETKVEQAEPKVQPKPIDICCNYSIDEIKADPGETQNDTSTAVTNDKKTWYCC